MATFYLMTGHYCITTLAYSILATHMEGIRDPLAGPDHQFERNFPRTPLTLETIYKKALTYGSTTVSSIYKATVFRDKGVLEKSTP